MPSKKPAASDTTTPPEVTFRGILILAGKTATGFVVPPDAVAALGATKKPAVTVSINAHTYRSTVAVMGGKFMLPVSAENRTAAGIAAGDEVDVRLVLDTAPRVIEVPPDFAAALDLVPAARQYFDTLSFSHQRAHVEPIVAAKAPETRARRIAKSVEMLGAGKAR